MTRPFRPRTAPAARKTSPRRRPQIETLDERCLPSAGMLDPTFHAPDGFVTKDFGSTSDTDRSLVVQPWDDAVLVGTNAPSNGGDFGVTRYTKDGALDTSFGVGGTATVDFARGFDNVLQVLVDPSSHKIVLVGRAQASTSAVVFGVARLNPNGSLDTTFGSKGKATINVWSDSSVSQTPNAATFDNQGRIVIAGVGLNFPRRGPSYYYDAIVRLTANGAPDSTFGTGGVLHGAAQSSSNSTWRSLLIQPDNSISVAGTDSGLAQIAHVTTGGVIDRRTPLYVPSAEYGNISSSFAFDTSGNVVWDGATNAPSESIALFRDRASDGQPDTTFGTGGMATIDLDGYFATHVSSYPELAAYVSSHDMTGHAIISNDTGYQPAYDAAGRLVIAGQADVRDLYTDASGNTQSVPIQQYSLLLRFNPDGTRDAGFGLGGVSATDLRPGYGQLFHRVALQSDGKIVASGVLQMDFGTPQNMDVSLARFTADPQMTTLTAAALTAPQTTPAVAPSSAGALALPPDQVVTQAESYPLTTPIRSAWRPRR